MPKTVKKIANFQKIGLLLRLAKRNPPYDLSQERILGLPGYRSSLINLACLNPAKGGPVNRLVGGRKAGRLGGLPEAFRTSRRSSDGTDSGHQEPGGAER